MPSPITAASFPAAFHARYAAASAKNASAFAWSAPMSPPRSGTPPSHATIAATTSETTASEVDFGVTTPSPLNGWALKTSVVPVTSARDISAASALPARRRMFLNDLSRALPSSVESSRSESEIESLPAKRKSSFLKRAPIQSTAARTSGTRMRPSPSASSIFNVSASKRRPSVDAASTVHSFWSSSFSAARSSPFSSLTCTQRADLKNFQLCIFCSLSMLLMWKEVAIVP